jgi:CcmD family protein
MSNIVPRILFMLCSLLITVAGVAQDTDRPEMADVMRSNGKIYAVVAILVVILLGIVLYLVRLDRKISKLEKETR